MRRDLTAARRYYEAAVRAAPWEPIARQKLAALAAHTSQVGARMADLEPRLRQWATELGAQYGFTYAEVFHETENG